MLSSSLAPIAARALLLGASMLGVCSRQDLPCVLSFTSGTGGEGTGPCVPVDELQFGERLQGPHWVPTPRAAAAHTQLFCCRSSKEWNK